MVKSGVEHEKVEHFIGIYFYFPVAIVREEDGKPVSKGYGSGQGSGIVCGQFSKISKGGGFLGRPCQ